MAQSFRSVDFPIRRRYISVLLLAAAITAGRAYGETKGPQVDGAERIAAIDGLIKQLERIYVLPEVTKKMVAAIRDRQAKGEYDAIPEGTTLAKKLTDDLRAVCHDEHLSVSFFPDGIPYDSEQPPNSQDVENFRRGGARRNFEFRRVEVLDGNVGLLEINGFYPSAWIGETLAGAMAFLQNCDAVIIDLRTNSGGDGALLLASYFFDEPVQFSSQFDNRDKSTRQSWSQTMIPPTKFGKTDLYLLTSHRTFSAPEGLAYDLQALKRGTIVGETTGGGAHPTTAFRLTDRFSAGIPFARSINPITQSDLEGVGVKPDVSVPADQALLTAHVLALKKAATKYPKNGPVAMELARFVTAKEHELELLRAHESNP